MRKAVIFLACILCFGTLINRGTFKDDISGRSVVQGVGVDLNADGSYTVTLETINTENYSNADGSAKPVMKIYVLNGKTVSDAINSAYSAAGKTPVMSQNRVIIIGKELAEHGITEALDYFIRDAENYPSVLVAATNKSAKDFFADAFSETGVTSRDVENIILTADEELTVSSVTLCETVNRIGSAGESFYMPIVSVSDKKEVRSSGTAVFRDGAFACALTEGETACLNFLCNNVQKGNVEFLCDGVPASISVVKSRTVRGVDCKSGVPQFSVKISIKADLSEFQKDSGKSITKADLQRLKICAEQKITSDIESLCRKLYRAECTDAAGLSRLIYIHCPEFFRQHEKNLNEIMAQSRFSVEVNVNIRRIGQDCSEGSS